MSVKTDQSETKIVERLEEGLLQLGDVYRKHQSYIKAKYKISALEMEIIQLVHLEGPKRMKDIGGYFDVKLSTLTSVVDKIEKQGLVKRVNSQEDRRVVLLQISRKGKKLYDQYQQYLHVVTLLTHRSMEPGDFTGFLEGLEKISEILTPPESPSALSTA
jgi:DNA-binding MarR family transcriptional regulator